MTLEVIGDSKVKLPSLTKRNFSHTMVISNNNELMTLGKGYHGDIRNQCYKLVNGIWQNQNPLTERRSSSVGISMPDGIYCFGGEDSPCTSDFLPNGQSIWQAGPTVPAPGIENGFGVAISPTELMLVGGWKTENKILMYNCERRTWTKVGKLLQGRYYHRCFFYGGEIVVTGGIDKGFLKSTELINISNGTSRKVGDLNVARRQHGMGIAHINGKSKLIVFGGQAANSSFLDSIEEWDEVSESWKMSTMKMSRAKSAFGYCQFPPFQNQIHINR